MSLLAYLFLIEPYDRPVGAARRRGRLASGSSSRSHGRCRRGTPVAATAGTADPVGDALASSPPSMVSAPSRHRRPPSAALDPARRDPERHAGGRHQPRSRPTCSARRSLWVVPLIAVPGTFVVAFSERGRRALPVIIAITPAALTLLWVPLGYTGGWPIVPLLLIEYAGIAIVAPRSTGDSPRTAGAEGLTGFYLTMSAGGAIGGAFVGIVAPRRVPRRSGSTRSSSPPRRSCWRGRGPTTAVEVRRRPIARLLDGWAWRLAVPTCRGGAGLLALMRVGRLAGRSMPRPGGCWSGPRAARRRPAARIRRSTVVLLVWSRSSSRRRRCSATAASSGVTGLPASTTAI